MNNEDGSSAKDSDEGSLDGTFLKNYNHLDIGLNQERSKRNINHESDEEEEQNKEKEHHKEDIHDKSEDEIEIAEIDEEMEAGEEENIE